MVCPLRFVIAGLSAAIVLFLALDMYWQARADDAQEEGASDGAPDGTEVRRRAPLSLWAVCPRSAGAGAA